MMWQHNEKRKISQNSFQFSDSDDVNAYYIVYCSARQHCQLYDGSLKPVDVRDLLFK